MLNFFENAVVVGCFAHPDDAELSAFGLFATARAAGAAVTIVNASDGESSRSAIGSHRRTEARHAAAVIGASAHTAHLPDGRVRYDVESVSAFERLMAQLRPTIVVTHKPQHEGWGHQDHAEISAAATNAALRCATVEMILHAEPPVTAEQFVPTLFVDVTAYFDLKLAAIACYQSEGTKPFMHPDIVRLRARWWALQSRRATRPDTCYEAFEVVRMTI